MLLRVALMALLPIVPFVVLYVALDPYRVLRLSLIHISEPTRPY